MQDLLKMVKSLEDSGILLNGITETVKSEVKEKKVVFYQCFQVLLVLLCLMTY